MLDKPEKAEDVVELIVSWVTSRYASQPACMQASGFGSIAELGAAGTMRISWALCTCRCLPITCLACKLLQLSESAPCASLRRVQLTGLQRPHADKSCIMLQCPSLPTSADLSDGPALSYALSAPDGWCWLQTVKEAEAMAEALQAAGLAAGCYHAQMEPGPRQAVHQAWAQGAQDAARMCAQCAPTRGCAGHVDAPRSWLLSAVCCPEQLRTPATALS